MQQPIDCTLGDECYIQQYMDRDPGEGFRDYQCSGLSYDGHKGTDFALPTRADMETGVDVLAAAAGVVRGFRDEMPDIGWTDEVATTFAGQECGNGVVLAHPDGWETQYCHLKLGSVTVTGGQRVAAGDVLGQVGQSGRAEFPHLHVSVRQDGSPVDPFDPEGGVTCGSAGDSALWADPLIYQPGGVLEVGFTDAVPEYDAVKAGGVGQASMLTNAKAIVIYGFTFGTQKDDVLELEIIGPKGSLIASDSVFERQHAQAFRAVGKRRRMATKWPKGTYTGIATLLRADQVISRQETQMIIE